MKIKVKNKNIMTDYGKNLLRTRGVEDVEGFLNPDETALQDWRDLEGIKDGVNLIFALPSKDARIGLIVDSDIDGFTSASIIGQYIQRYLPGCAIVYYIHEGKAHGLEEHWKEIRDMNYNLVICPDSATNDSEYAERLGCPILVIDHHLLESPIMAPNLVVINNQLSPKYRNKDLSGAGVTYQFCRAMDYYFEKNWSDDYVDLAALGICGDMMSGLEVENQYLWRKGFGDIKNYFFWTIAQKQSYSITGKMGASDKELLDALNPISVAFYIVPLINAMVRVGTEDEKARMLAAFIDGHKMVPSLKRGAKGTLEEVAVESTRECTNARTHQNKIKEDAVARLEQKILKHGLLENQILFVRLEDNDKFPSELNGLVAMALSQKYKRPTIVARLNEEGYVRGSARGLNNSELVDFKGFLNETGLFEYTAGHSQAFGLSIPNSNLSRLHEIANEGLFKYNFGEEYYEVDFKRHAFDDDLEDIIYDLARYNFVWSQQNPTPLVYIHDLYINSCDIQFLGKNKDTVRFEKNGIVYLKFFAKELINEIRGRASIKFEIVGKVNLNQWNGILTPQIFIENYEVKEDSLLDF